jgi:hypothetical protein
MKKHSKGVIFACSASQWQVPDNQHKPNKVAESKSTAVWIHSNPTATSACKFLWVYLGTQGKTVCLQQGSSRRV